MACQLKKEQLHSSISIVPYKWRNHPVHMELFFFEWVDGVIGLLLRHLSRLDELKTVF